MPDAIIVASYAKWVHEDLAAVKMKFPYRKDFPVHYSYGLGLPNLRGSERPAFWTSTAHAARLKRQMHLPLIAPGPRFLDDVPSNLKGRKVTTYPLAFFSNGYWMEKEELHWVKLAEMKDDRLPAQRCFIRDFVLKAKELGAPDDAMMQVSPINLCLTNESRFFVLNGKVVTGSAYTQLGEIYDPGMEDAVKWREQPGSYEWMFAQYIVDYLADRQPAAYTLDVGQHMEDWDSMEWPVVIEFNPVWSSALYASDPELALTAILAGVDYDPEAQYLWKPDPWLIQRADYKGDMKPE